MIRPTTQNLWIKCYVRPSKSLRRKLGRMVRRGLIAKHRYQLAVYE